MKKIEKLLLFLYKFNRQFITKPIASFTISIFIMMIIFSIIVIMVSGIENIFSIDYKNKNYIYYSQKIYYIIIGILLFLSFRLEKKVKSVVRKAIANGEIPEEDLKYVDPNYKDYKGYEKEQRNKIVTKKNYCPKCNKIYKNRDGGVCEKCHTLLTKIE